MNTYMMYNGLLHKNSAGVALHIPQKDLADVAPLFLREGEELVIRPERSTFRWARMIAYGVHGNNWRRLPIAAASH